MLVEGRGGAAVRGTPALAALLALGLVGSAPPPRQTPRGEPSAWPGARPAWAAGRDELLWEHRNLGKAFYENPTTQYEAVEQFKQALALAPDSGRERLNYGLALLKAGKTAEGIAELQRVEKQAPEIPHPWFNLGIVLKRDVHTTRRSSSLEAEGGGGGRRAGFPVQPRHPLQADRQARSRARPLRDRGASRPRPRRPPLPALQRLQGRRAGRRRRARAGDLQGDQKGPGGGGGAGRPRAEPLLGDLRRSRAGARGRARRRRSSRSGWRGRSPVGSTPRLPGWRCW